MDSRLDTNLERNWGTLYLDRILLGTKRSSGPYRESWIRRIRGSSREFSLKTNFPMDRTRRRGIDSWIKAEIPIPIRLRAVSGNPGYGGSEDPVANSHSKSTSRWTGHGVAGWILGLKQEFPLRYGSGPYPGILDTADPRIQSRILTQNQLPDGTDTASRDGFLD
eukprot:gene13052-biopygen3933